MKMQNVLFILFATFASFVLTSCKSSSDEGDEVAAPTPVCFESGDILVANGGSDAIMSFSSTGAFKKIIYQLNTAAGEALYGMDYIESTGEVAVVVDGTDRVMAIDPETCAARILIADANLNGTLRGITQLSTGDLLVVETSNVERFSSTGVRITTGSWPKALQTTGADIHALAAGGFVHCSTGSDVVRTYDDAGTQVATRASGIAGTTDAMGCKELANGSIAAAWSGTTDSVVIYSSNLATAQYTYSNTAVLSTPGSLAQKNDGNILVADRVLNYLVEISPTGTYVGTIGGGYLNVPEFILVIP